MKKEKVIQQENEDDKATQLIINDIFNDQIDTQINIQEILDYTMVEVDEHIEKKCIINKRPSFLLSHINSSILQFSLLNLNQQYKDNCSEFQSIGEDEEFKEGILDNFAIQSINVVKQKKEESVNVSQITSNKTFQKSISRLSQIRKKTESLTEIQVKKNSEKEIVNECLPIIDEEDPKPLTFQQKVDELIEIELREQKVQEEIKQENQAQFFANLKKQVPKKLPKNHTYDVDGTLIKLKPQKVETLPNSISIPEYKYLEESQKITQEIFTKKPEKNSKNGSNKPSDHQQKVILLQQSVQQTQNPQTLKKKQSQLLNKVDFQEYSINNIDLVKGAVLKNDQGIIKEGPKDPVLQNQIRKSQYNNLIQDQNLKPKDQKKQEMSSGLDKQSTIQIQQDSFNNSMAAEGNKEIQIFSNPDYKHLLNNISPKSRIHSSKPKYFIKSKVSGTKQNTNISSLKNIKSMNNKNYTKIDEFNSLIMKDQNWGQANINSEKSPNNSINFRIISNKKTKQYFFQKV